MARKKDTRNICYSLFPNTLPGTSGCHAAVTHAATRDEEAFFSSLVRQGACRDKETARLVWLAAAEKAAELLSEHQYRIVLEDMTLELALSGSSTSLDGALPADSELYVAIRPSARIRNAAAGLSPLYVPLGENVQPRIDYVEDLSSGTKGAKGVITGRGPFRLAVFNATATGEGEGVRVVAADGTEATATVTAQDGLGTSVTATLDAELPPGKATLTLMTRGWLTPEGNPLPYTKKVTLLAGEAPSGPTFTKVTAPGHEDDAMWANKVARDGKIVVIGAGFTDDLVAVFKTGDTPETFNVTARTATSITGQIAGGLEVGSGLAFELQKADGTVLATAAIEVVE